jgi:hypothetical protein
MVVLLYALEVEVTNELDGPDRDKLMRDAAGAYRARADMLIAAGKVTQAEVDLNRAEKLEAEARKIADKKKQSKTETVPAELPH